MTMIERVARAICDAEPFLESGKEEYWRRHKHAYENMARAAIEAMREPTDSFLEHLSARMHDAQHSVSGEDYPVARNFIRAFVDAALNEKGKP